MKERFINMRTRLLVLLVVELAVMILMALFLSKYPVFIQSVLYIIIFIDGIVILSTFMELYNTYRLRVASVSKTLGTDVKKAFDFGEITIFTFDEQYNITWVSEGFDDYIGESIMDKIPLARRVILGHEKTLQLEIEKSYYEISTMESENVLFLKRINLLHKLEVENKKNKLVLGIAHLDNYTETTQYEDEQKIALIDSNIRQAVVRWADEHDMYVRRLRADRYLLLLTESNFETLIKEKFSILQTVRDQAQQMDSNITLSLAFARGSNNFKELEELSNNALETAQGRGGDQAVISTFNQGNQYYGGTTEAIEKRSKVRVRVVAQSLGNLMSEASNIIIVGHKMMDFDCFGSALGISDIARNYDKTTYIAVNEEDVDSGLGKVIVDHRDQLAKRHRLINGRDFDSIINENTLLILVDHHNRVQCQYPDLIERIENKVIIDHHRRNGSLEFKPKLTYIETSASSACELVVELLPYHKRSVHLPVLDATIMYTGMLVDTNRFRNRCGSRTFEAAAELRKFGANIEMAEDMLRDEYESFEERNKMLSKSELFMDEYVIVAYKDALANRVTMSKVADEIIQVRNVEASFVVADVSENIVGISARSKGDLNVQLVMERLGGGGHFTGAAAQVRGQTINEVVERLKEVILEVKQEVE